MLMHFYFSSSLSHSLAHLLSSDFGSASVIFVAKCKSQWNWTLIHCERSDSFIHMYIYIDIYCNLKFSHFLQHTHTSTLTKPYCIRTLSGKVILYAANMSFSLCWPFVYEYFFLGRSFSSFDKMFSYFTFHLLHILYVYYSALLCLSLCLRDLVFFSGTSNVARRLCICLFVRSFLFVYLFACTFSFCICHGCLCVRLLVDTFQWEMSPTWQCMTIIVFEFQKELLTSMTGKYSLRAVCLSVEIFIKAVLCSQFSYFFIHFCCLFISFTCLFVCLFACLFVFFLVFVALFVYTIHDHSFEQNCWQI